MLVGMVIGFVLGIGTALVTAIFFPGAWSKLYKEASEEVKKP